MTYEEYEKEMDKLQQEYSKAVTEKDWELCDVIQKRMDRLTERTTRIADANLRQQLKG